MSETFGFYWFPSSDTPISLYLDLEDGQTADIEVVARTALAFSAAIKECAYILDPSLEVRVELASGTAGSLSLNSIIKSIKKAKDEPVTLGAVALLMAIWIGGQVGAWTVEQALDHMFNAGVAEHHKFSAEELKQIQETVQEALNGRIAERQVQQIYREVERDKVIKGIGIPREPGQRPEVIVPRSEFPARAGMDALEVTSTHRTVPQRITVVLVSPMLVPGTRRWRFQAPWGEFGAPITDQEFTERVLTGTTAVPMVAGIQMDVELQTEERLRNGVWVPGRRWVTRIYAMRHPPVQGGLPFAEPQNDQSRQDDR
jgi:hypothetical protein